MGLINEQLVEARAKVKKIRRAEKEYAKAVTAYLKARDDYWANGTHQTEIELRRASETRFWKSRNSRSYGCFDTAIAKVQSLQEAVKAERELENITLKVMEEFNKSAVATISVSSRTVMRM